MAGISKKQFQKRKKKWRSHCTGLGLQAGTIMVKISLSREFASHPLLYRVIDVDCNLFLFRRVYHWLWGSGYSGEKALCRRYDVWWTRRACTILRYISGERITELLASVRMTKIAVYALFFPMVIANFSERSLRKVCDNTCTRQDRFGRLDELSKSYFSSPSEHHSSIMVPHNQVTKIIWPGSSQRGPRAWASQLIGHILSNRHHS